MAAVGYTRVSTSQQTTAQQTDALNAVGVEKIFSDVMSGARDDRPGLAELLAYVREGDVVTVVALDRLGRSLSGIIRTVEQLQERGVYVRSLRESIDTSTSVGRMLTGLFGALAQYERDLIRERADAAREAARARGQQVGRPRALTADQVRQARALHAAGEPVGAIAKTMGCGRATLYRMLAEAV